MDCPACGTQIKPFASYCHECGRMMELPFRVTSKEEVNLYSVYGNRIPVKCFKNVFPVQLYELQDGRFTSFEEGLIMPFMAGPGYVLVEAALADFLDELDMPGLKIRNAVIWNRRKSDEYTTHKRLLIEQHFRTQEISEVDIRGNKLMIMNNRHVFATPGLKVRLESESRFNYLGFFHGLARFSLFVPCGIFA